MRCLRSVLLPEPLPPITTKTSADRTVKWRFLWITKPPYAISRSTTSIRGGASGAEGAGRSAAMARSEPEHEEDDAQDAVRDDGEYDRRDDCGRGSQSDGCGAPPALHTAQTPGHGDQDAEDHGSDEPHGEIGDRDDVHQPDH